MIDSEKWIKDNVRCCACGGSLKRSRFINMIALDKLATWKWPVWGNVLLLNKYPMNRAIAILCDKCIEKNRKPKYAVEWDMKHNSVKYHLIKNLKDLPPIPPEEALTAEAKLWIA